MADPWKKPPSPMSGGSIASILSEARATTERASLLKPSRPFTPRDRERSLFSGSDYRPSSRPSSTFSTSSFGSLGDTGLLDTPTSRFGRSSSGRRLGSSLGRPPTGKPSTPKGGAMNWSWAGNVSDEPHPTPPSSPTLDSESTPSASQPESKSDVPSPPPSKPQGTKPSPKTIRARAHSGASSDEAPPAHEPQTSASAIASPPIAPWNTAEADEKVDLEVEVTPAVVQALALAVSVLEPAASDFSVLRKASTIASESGDEVPDSKVGEDSRRRSRDTSGGGGGADDSDVALIEWVKKHWVNIDALSAALSKIDKERVKSKTAGQMLADATGSAMEVRLRLIRNAGKSIKGSSSLGLLHLAKVVLKLANTPEPRTVVARRTDAKTPATSAVRSYGLHVSRAVLSAAKRPGNDELFRTEGMLDVLVESLEAGRLAKHEWAVPSSSPSKPIQRGGFDFSSCPAQVEELIYVVGALKLASADDRNAKWLVERTSSVGALTDLAWGALDIVNSKDKADGPVSKRLLAQLLVQVTGCLRNLCLSKKHISVFWEMSTVDALLGLLPGLNRHSELSHNVARVMGKLSLFRECRERLTSVPEYLAALVTLLSMHNRHTALIVRVAFTLGNVTASNEGNRVALATAHGCVTPLLQLLSQYTKSYVTMVAAGSDTVPSGPAGSDGHSGSESKGDDSDPSGGKQRGKRKNNALTKAAVSEILVKLLRLLANLAISPVIGPRLTVTAGVDVVIDLLETGGDETVEEMVLNATGALTNLSFYMASPESHARTGVPEPLTAVAAGEGGDIVYRNRFRITRALSPMLRHPNEEAVVEAARAFGNFTRDDGVRMLMFDLECFNALCNLLAAKSPTILHTVCGVFINLVSDEPGKQAVRTAPEDGIGRLIDLLDLHWEGDNELAETICKVLFNYILGWKGSTPEGATPRLDAKPRLTAEQCMNLLLTLDGIIECSGPPDESDEGDAIGDPAESKSGRVSDGKAEDAEAEGVTDSLLDVATKLRSSAQEIVQSGAVVTSIASPMRLAASEPNELEPL